MRIGIHRLWLCGVLSLTGAAPTVSTAVAESPPASAAAADPAQILQWVRDLGSDNYNLRSDSPCIGGNEESDDIYCGSMGACPVACGAVSVERTTWGRIKNLYR